MSSPSNQFFPSFLSGASVTGLKHRCECTCNQDALQYQQYPYGIIMAVADGVGSECYSQFGSKSAVEAVHAAFCELAAGAIGYGQLLDSIVNKYKAGVAEEYRLQASTTCIYAAHIYGQGLYLGQIGDGICCGTINGTDFILSQKSDGFTNLVIPLSCNQYVGEWAMDFIPEKQIQTISVMLATDGISEDILPGKEAPFCNFVIDKVTGLLSEEKEKYLQQMLYEWATPKSVDDKTLCLYSFHNNGE